MGSHMNRQPSLVHQHLLADLTGARLESATSRFYVHLPVFEVGERLWALITLMLSRILSVMQPLVSN